MHDVKLRVCFTLAHLVTIKMPYERCVSDATVVQDLHALRRLKSQGHENECLSQWGAWLVWMPSASALHKQCEVDIPCSKHLWDATDKVRTAFSTVKTARACYPGSQLTNSVNCLAARTALGRHAERDWMYLPVGEDAARGTWCVLRQYAETQAVYIKMHACHAV